jgi:hypothetical protein
MLISKWLQEFTDAQYLEKGASVPCGDCRGCCTSGYFIHIQPHEKATLAAIPKKLLFPAPGLPKGNVLLGYRENGHCPMFKTMPVLFMKIVPKHVEIMTAEYLPRPE